MASVTFLWHLHQPSYRRADGTALAPWVALHAGGAYTTLARAILESGGRGHVVNIVPVLLEQMEAYSDGTVTDPVVAALATPSAELDEEGRATLLQWGFHVTPRQLERYPRLSELTRRGRTAPSSIHTHALFGPADLRDLQVLFILSQAGEQAWRDDDLRPLHDIGGGFSGADFDTAAAWLLRQPARLLQLWRALGDREGVEIATSPYAHPIMPLLIDTGVVEESWAPSAAPPVPEFAHPEDARAQLAAGLELMAAQGFAIRGCWPPEGSVSDAALEIYGDAGVRWLVTDEGILEKSLGRSLRADGRLPIELYGSWRRPGRAPLLFFRDRHLSDRIGFVYGRWQDEQRAAADLVQHLERLAARLPQEAAIVLALDGENPWLHYPQGGGTFLRTAMEGIEASDLEPATLGQLSEALAPMELPRLHPGSWIGGTFSTWIGHPEKSRAWKVLADVRNAVANAAELPPSMLLAEGSDWFWWLGDDNPTALAPLYDRIFRGHLADACAQAGVAPPEVLAQPIKTATVSVRVPVSDSWQAPVLDGRITSYFEWSLAVWVTGTGPLQRLGLWGGGGLLHVLVEGDLSISHLLRDLPLRVRLESPTGEAEEVTVTGDGCEPPEARCAIGRVAELSLPWNGRPSHRLLVQLGEQSLPDDAVLLLAPFLVDEGDHNHG